MRHWFLLATLGLSAVAPLASADGLIRHRRIHDPSLPTCEPGYVWVEETCFHDVERFCCKMVPDKKTRTKHVYSTKNDPFCEKNAGGLGLLQRLFHPCSSCCDSGECPTCDGPHCRVQLVKKSVKCEEPTMKCVIERTVEKVPYTVRKKVRCDQVHEGPPILIQQPGVSGVVVPESRGVPIDAVPRRLESGSEVPPAKALPKTSTSPSSSRGIIPISNVTVPNAEQERAGYLRALGLPR